MSAFIHVAPVLRVADMARSLSFYRDKLGFELEFSYEGFYAGVVRDGCHLHLRHSNPEVRNQVAFEAEEQLDACFRVQDAQAIASQFKAAGIVFSVPLRKVPYGEEFYVKDPDGYILGFVQPA